MTHVRLAPDRLGLLGAQHLQRDGLHRRHRSELHEPLGFRMAELAGSAGDGIEAGDEEPSGALATRFAGHGTHLRAGVGRSSAVPNGPVPCQAQGVSGTGVSPRGC